MPPPVAPVPHYIPPPRRYAPIAPAPRGLHSSDNSQEAAARRDLHALQRENHVARRGGEEVDPTSSVDTFMRGRNEQELGETTGPAGI